MSSRTTPLSVLVRRSRRTSIYIYLLSAVTAISACARGKQWRALRLLALMQLTSVLPTVISYVRCWIQGEGSPAIEACLEALESTASIEVQVYEDEQKRIQW